jgi:hypothetical protein
VIRNSVEKKVVESDDTIILTSPHCHPEGSFWGPYVGLLLAHDSDVQFGVTHTTGGYDGSFCTGTGKLPCCACVMVEANNMASRTNAKVKYGVVGMTRSRLLQAGARFGLSATGA